MANGSPVGSKADCHQLGSPECCRCHIGGLRALRLMLGMREGSGEVEECPLRERLFGNWDRLGCLGLVPWGPRNYDCEKISMPFLLTV